KDQIGRENGLTELENAAIAAMAEEKMFAKYIKKKLFFLDISKFGSISDGGEPSRYSLVFPHPRLKSALLSDQKALIVLKCNLFCVLEGQMLEGKLRKKGGDA